MGGGGFLLHPPTGAGCYSKLFFSLPRPTVEPAIKKWMGIGKVKSEENSGFPYPAFPFAEVVFPIPCLLPHYYSAALRVLGVAFLPGFLPQLQIPPAP